MSKNKRLTVDISENLHNEFKSAAAKRGLTITAAVEALIVQWLREQTCVERGDSDAS